MATLKERLGIGTHPYQYIGQGIRDFAGLLGEGTETIKNQLNQLPPIEVVPSQTGYRPDMVVPKGTPVSQKGVAFNDYGNFLLGNTDVALKDISQGVAPHPMDALDLGAGAASVLGGGGLLFKAGKKGLDALKKTKSTPSVERLFGKKGDYEVKHMNGITGVYKDGKPVVTGDYDYLADGFFMTDKASKQDMFFENATDAMDYVDNRIKNSVFSKQDNINIPKTEDVLGKNYHKYNNMEDISKNLLPYESDLNYTLNSIAPKNAQVYTRAKLPEKVQLKIDAGKNPQNISDSVGGRIVVDKAEDVIPTLNKLDKKSNILSIDNWFDKYGHPTNKDGYRAVHVQLGNTKGTSAEVQIIPKDFIEINDAGKAAYDNLRHKSKSLSTPEYLKNKCVQKSSELKRDMIYNKMDKEMSPIDPFTEGLKNFSDEDMVKYGLIGQNSDERANRPRNRLQTILGVPDQDRFPNYFGL